MVMPGLVARRLFDDELRTGGPDGAADWNEALPLMMKRLLPPGLLGLNLAATIAACMSSLDSVFTAAASLFCLDLYHGYMRTSATERELVMVGRAFCALLAVVTLLWLPVIDLMSDQVFVYIQSISMYLSPPIVSVYFCGALWKRANAPGAVAAFTVGYTLGFGRMLGEIVCKLSPPPTGSVADLLFVRMNYLYVGTLLCAVSVATQLIVTLATPPPHASQVDGLTVQWALPRCCQRTAIPATRSMHVEMVCSAASASAVSDPGRACGLEVGSLRVDVPAGAGNSTPTREAPAQQREQPPTTPPLAAMATPTAAKALDGGSDARFEMVNIVLSIVLVVVIISLGATFM